MKDSYTVEDLLKLYEERGDGHYGQEIAQTEHALQCAALARRDGAPDEMIAAALLHDVGHLIANVQGEENFDLAGRDDGHEGLGGQVLLPIFGTNVARPVALHVMAKRWRCTTDPDYYEHLSPGSRATLEAQGGPLSPESRARFEAHQGFESALTLRSWDEDANVVGLDVGKMRDYKDLLTRLASSE
jgi:predicted HD phosphohydrolase